MYILQAAVSESQPFSEMFDELHGRGCRARRGQVAEVPSTPGPGSEPRRPLQP